METNLLLLPLLVLVSLAGGQKEPRLGKDGRPLLNKPIAELCKDRKYHEKYKGHHYFLSWREPWNKFEDWDWFNGRNFCRERCMDLVSFETADEYRHFAKMMFRGLSGRVLFVSIIPTVISRQHHCHVDQWEEVQLSQQGLRLCSSPACQCQRMVLGGRQQKVNL